MRQILIILCMFLVTFSVSAQEVSRTAKNDVKVSDAWVSREGRTLIIDYSIDLGENIISCDVALMMSLDGGYTFSPVAMTDKVKGDVGRITTSGQKQITYDIDSIKESLAGKKLAFKVQVKNKKKVQDNKEKFFFMGTASSLGMYGVRIGGVKKFGGYLAYSDGFENGMFNQWSATAGFVMRATPWMYPYVGAGMGWLSWKDTESGYYGFGILPFEAGAMFKLGLVSLSAAVEPILVFEKGMLATFEFGVGFFF